MSSSIDILSKKNREFEDLYVGGPDYLRGNACRMYKHKHIHPQCKDSTAETCGPRILRKVQVQAYLRDKVQRIQEETDVNAQWVLNEAVRLYKRCMGDDQPGQAVAGQDDEQHLRFNAAGAKSALELIGKNILVQAFRDSVDVSAKVDLVSVMDRAQKRVEAAALRRIQ